MKRLLDILIKLSQFIAIIFGICLLVSVCFVRMGFPGFWVALFCIALMAFLDRRRRKEENQRPKLITTI